MGFRVVWNKAAFAFTFVTAHFVLANGVFSADRSCPGESAFVDIYNNRKQTVIDLYHHTMNSEADL